MDEVLNANVILWGKIVGFINWEPNQKIASFQYKKEFLEGPIEPSPYMVRKRSAPYTFLDLKKSSSFRGLPGMLADSLPDDYGNAVIDEWLIRSGRKKNGLNPVERLCYISTRGMGALEYTPAISKSTTNSHVELDVKELIKFANTILQKREDLKVSLEEDNINEAMKNILEIGSTAGGARAKCVVAYNKKEKKIISGQLSAPKGYTHWLLKLDGVQNNGEKGFLDPQGYLNIEYAYHLIALKCGIEMSKCEQLIEGERYHFITRRFDRKDNGEKLHMQTLSGMAHLDYNIQFVNSYEMVVEIIKAIIPKERIKKTLEQYYRRAVFNIIGINQDDHTKNMSFIMNKKGEWYMAPAYDISYNKGKADQWTAKHQLQLNGKVENIKRSDLKEFGKTIGISTLKANDIIDEVFEAFSLWDIAAEKAGLNKVKSDFTAIVKKALQERKDYILS